jgi:hypothetical protein
MAGKGSKARPLSVKYEEFSDRWDSAFKKKLTSEEWCKLKNVEIIDPDGWRNGDENSWTERITEEEFENRRSRSTVNYKPSK